MEACNLQTGKKKKKTQQCRCYFARNRQHLTDFKTNTQSKMTNEFWISAKVQYSSLRHNQIPMERNFGYVSTTSYSINSINLKVKDLRSKLKNDIKMSLCQ